MVSIGIFVFCYSAANLCRYLTLIDEVIETMVSILCGIYSLPRLFLYYLY